MYSVRRVSDYLSSHIDLNDYTRKDIGSTQRDDGPKEMINHHAPLTPSAKEHAINRIIQKSSLFKRVSDITWYVLVNPGVSPLMPVTTQLDRGV